jgi:cytochrome b
MSTSISSRVVGGASAGADDSQAAAYLGAGAAVHEIRSGLPLKRIRVWDLPTRLFHWSLVLAVSVAVATGLVGGDWMPVHGYAGLAIVGLVSFRLVWGVAGSAHARFLNFAPTPGRLRAYFTGRWQGQGHNPLGALSVFALLALLAVQAVTGLLGNDEISFTGPLARLVEESTSLRLTGLHQQLAYVLLGFLALHVAAVLVYLAVRKTNLVKPMVTGWKEVPGTAEGHGASASWPALAAALAVAVLATYYASGAGF